AFEPLIHPNHRHHTCLNHQSRLFLLNMQTAIRHTRQKLAITIKARKMPETPANILNRIREAKKNQSKTLRLHYSNLTEIPDEVFALPDLEVLSLRNSNITSIPDKIKKLKKLKQLDLFANDIKQLPDMPGLMLDYKVWQQCGVSAENITGLRIESDIESWPAEVYDLVNLTELEMADRAQHIIPTDITRLGQLEGLSISGNHLVSIPQGIAQLTSLKFLNLSGNQLTSLPDWLFELQALEALYIGRNQLNTIPVGMTKLSKLKHLSVEYNQFDVFPQPIFELKCLTYLNISGRGKQGEIKAIPADILKLKNLKYLRISGQPIQSPPPEVVSKGIDSIRNYFIQLETDQDYLSEAKLIIVGEGGAGKTTLAKKIENAQYQLTDNQHSTEGIDVIEWDFPTQFDIERDGQKQTIQQDLRANIWDFGGQEIYHATHQFFLTKRSVYVLVADNRKEDTDFNYWLSIIELLSDNSPVLIVKNEKQDRIRDINETRLRERFGNLKQVLSVNLATNRGLEAVLDAVQQQMAQLPHIGTPLPRTWKDVRQVLEQDSRDHISLKEYLALCEQHGFTNTADKLQLSGYLHDLGICLHFQDDPLLKDIVILKPTWGTDAVYRVLDHHDILATHGRFSLSTLKAIWAEEKYASMHMALLQLMIKFKLCYAIDNGDTYIAPQLLELTQPDYAWDDNDNLTMKYRYDFMPKGIITRFIVALHPLIVDQEVVWKDGVVLEYQDTQARVIEDYPQRQITVSLAGEHKKDLLRIVDETLTDIHQSYPQLKVDEWLPCTCSVCRSSDNPHFYPYTVIKRFTEDEKEIQCQVSYEMVDAEEVLEHVGLSKMKWGIELSEYGFQPQDFSHLGQKPPSFAESLSIKTQQPAKPAKPNLQLTKVVLTDIRCFKQLTVLMQAQTDNNDETVLWSMILGDNSAGKTTLLRSIALGLCRESEAIALIKEIPGSFIRKGCDVAKITLYLCDSSCDASGNSHQPKKTYTITTEIQKTGDNAQDSEEIVRQKTKPVKDFPWSDVFVCGYGVHRSGKAVASYEKYSAFDAVKSLFDDQTSMQNPELVLLKRNKSTRRLLEQKLLQILMLDAPEDTLSYPQTGFELSGPWGQFPVSVLSDGYRVTMQWVLDFIGWLIYADRLTDNPNIGGILLLDEIEQHLHPRWQRFIVERLRKQFPQTQIIATTHTPLTASGIVDVDAGLLIKLEQTEPGIINQRVIDQSTIMGRRADQILVSDAFGLVTTRNPGSEDLIDRFSTLLGKTQRSEAEQSEFENLSTQLQEALSEGESPIERQIDKAVDDSLKRVLNNVTADSLDEEAKSELRELFSIGDAL
ncbi:MAG: internalin A, partial [Phenylobacterium sp.]